MAMRVKNISEGYVDANGAFHPIRAASDYRAKRAGEAKKYATGKKRKASKAKKTVTVAHVRRAAKKTVAQIKAALAPKRRVARKNPNKWLGDIRVKRLDTGKIVSHHRTLTASKEAAIKLAKKGIHAQVWDNAGLYVDVPARAVAKAKNPLPVGKYIKAKVKRMANGDVKVMISR